MNGTLPSFTVYNYQGQFPSAVVGEARVTDADDHDHADKTFLLDSMSDGHFTVDAQMGNITMLKGTPAGLHILR